MSNRSAFVLSSPFSIFKTTFSSQQIPKRRRTTFLDSNTSILYKRKRFNSHNRSSSLTPSAVQSEEPLTSQQSTDKTSVNNQSLSSSNGSPLDSSFSTSIEKQIDENETEQITSNQAPPQVSVSLGPIQFSIPSRWLLYSVPFLWGSFAPAVRLLFAQHPHQDPSIFNSERLLLSTLMYMPILITEFKAYQERDSRKQSSSSSSTYSSHQTTKNSQDTSNDRFSFFPAGIELGIYVFLANVAQVIGLQQTSASRAAFLTQLQTVIVPVLSGLLGLDKISSRTWISSIVAVTGVALLSSDKGHGTEASLVGDSLEIVSALFFSAYIIRLSKYCSTVAANPLVATKIAVQAILSIVWAFSAEALNVFSHNSAQVADTSEQIVSWTLTTISINIGVVAWTGLMSSAISGWAQTRGQQGVPASEAVVIFATQPLWASGLAALVLGERFGINGLGGGALIVAATLLSSLKNDSEDKVKDTKT